MTTPEQEKAIREWLQEAIVPLIEQVLVKKLGQAMSFAAQEILKPKVGFVDSKLNPIKHTWVGLTDEEVVDLKMLGRDLEFVSMTALRRFARDIETTLKEKNT